MPSITYAPTAIRYVSADDLFVAFERSPVQADGAPAPAKFWNHSTGGFEAGFDQAKHVRAMTRMSPVGSSNANFQGFGVPWDVAVGTAVHALVYKRNAQGLYVEYGRVEAATLRISSGAE